MNNEIEKIFETVKDDPQVETYTNYVKSIAPKTSNEVFWRFIFAFLSIHSTYKSNLRGYMMLRNPGAWSTYQTLRDALVASSCGMHNQRARFLWKFREEFFRGQYSDLTLEPGLQRRRNILVDKLLGIGMAKVSFALEMSFPTQSSIVCLDVHHLRLYGKDPNKLTKKDYMECEDDWCKRSRAVGVAPFVVRNIFWDRLKKQPSPRFWSYVFEKHGDQLPVEAASGLKFEDSLEQRKQQHEKMQLNPL